MTSAREIQGAQPDDGGAIAETARVPDAVDLGGRLWEVDALRGVAILAMFAYHLAWDLDQVDAIERDSVWWDIFGRSIGTTFAFVAGVSLVLALARADRRAAPALAPLRPLVVRGLRIAAIGAGITAVTWAIYGRPVILFGILSLLGFGMVLAVPFLRRPPLLALSVGLAAIAGGVLLWGSEASAWLVWLGPRPEGEPQYDRYPLLPFWGPLLLGVALAGVAYGGGRRRFRLPDVGAAAPVRGLRALGANSLAIYLLHQPVLYGLVLLVFAT